MSKILPGLPDDVALLCLARVTRTRHALLRAVSKTWKEVLDSKQFYEQRKKLGISNETIFSMKVASFDPPGELHVMEIDVETSICSKAVFFNDALAAYFFHEGYGCASVQHLVLFFGGHDPFPSATLHVFNTLNRSWTQGANMQFPRSVCGYGVIDNKLYVVGGYTGKYADYQLTSTEVYNAEVNSWSSVASLPFAMDLIFCCVWRENLIVQGQTSRGNTTNEYVFSYCPQADHWQEEQWLLHAFRPFEPPFTPVATKCGSLHVGMAQQSAQDYADVMKIMKFDMETLKWACLSQEIDEANEYHCECEIEGQRLLKVLGLKDRVLVLHHLGDEDVWIYKLVSSEQIMKLQLECPYPWLSTIVDF